MISNQMDKLKKKNVENFINLDLPTNQFVICIIKKLTRTFSSSYINLQLIKCFRRDVRSRCSRGKYWPCNMEPISCP